MLAYLYVRSRLFLADLRGAMAGRTPVRAAGLLEYALLALLAVGVFAVLASVFSGSFNTILCNVQTTLGGQGGGECAVTNPLEQQPSGG